MLQGNGLESGQAEVTIHVSRPHGLQLLPESEAVDLLMLAKALPSKAYVMDTKDRRADLFKDHFIAPGLLSNLQTVYRMVHILAGVYAGENGFDCCLLINTAKSVVESTDGNIFLVQGSTITTPPLSVGCKKGVFRQQLMDVIQASPEYELKEASISPFDLVKGDELFTV